MPSRRRTARRFDLVVFLAGCLAAVLAALPARTPLAATPAGDDFAAAAVVVDPSVVGILGREAGALRDRGAGFVWRPGGLVVTAAHVVERDTAPRVRLADGRELPARLLGADDLADVAVLKIDADPPIAVAAPAGTVRRGDPVAAIGDPLGFAATLTVGHVSHPARPWGDASPWDVLQHDAALNPGSSGGPLVDRAGRVVAMNVAIADGARRHVGIGLALPIEVVERIADRLVRDGAIARPHLGARVRPAGALRPAMPALADGLLVEAVDHGSPAARAGLAPGDLVVAIDGIATSSPRDLARALEPRHPGDAVTLTVVSSAAASPPRAATRSLAGSMPAAPHRRTLAVPLAATPPRTVVTTPAEPVGLGLTLEPGGSRLVVAVEPDTPADGAGLAAGDEILAIGDHRLDGDDATDPVALPASTGEAGVALLVRRGDKTRWLVLGPHGRLDGEAPFGSNAEALTSHPF